MKNNVVITSALSSAKPALKNDVLDPVCRLSPDVDPCKALVPGWVFDASQGRCIEFSYGGCRAMTTNFTLRRFVKPNVVSLFQISRLLI
nr:hypothetical transcript [Hymenolepis microstoma]